MVWKAIILNFVMEHLMASGGNIQIPIPMNIKALNM